MTSILVDSNVLLDVFTEDPSWFEWSADALARCADRAALVINPLVFAEVSVRFRTVEELDDAIPPEVFRREALPYEAAFLAGKAFAEYRGRRGPRLSLLPDFYIGAHAAVACFGLLTRDATRYRTYYPGVSLIAP